MDIIAIVTQFIIPPLLGGLGGTISVWMNWGIERRRMRIKRQQKSVDSWRTNLLPLLIKNQADRSEFVHHQAYAKSEALFVA